MLQFEQPTEMFSFKGTIRLKLPTFTFKASLETPREQTYN